MSRATRTSLLALALLSVLASACRRDRPHVDAVATHDRTSEVVRGADPLRACLIEGSMRLDARAWLYGGRDAATPLAGFDHSVLQFSVREVPELVVDRVGLRVSNGKGFALDGWLDRDALSFAARMRIPLAGDVAWIPRGAPLSLKLGVANKVVVTPSTKHLAPLDALVPCDTLAIGPVEAEPHDGVVGQSYAPAIDRIPVSSRAGGPPIFTLHLRAGASTELHVQDTPLGLRLRFHDGIAVDGYVEKSSLSPLTSLSLGAFSYSVSHAYGRASLPPTARFARARRTTAVHVGATPESPSAGVITRDADLIVVEERGAFASALPRCRELMPVGANAFWVARADLQMAGVVGPGAPGAPHDCH